MAEILVGLLGPAIELGKCIAAPIKRHFNYLCCFNSNIQSLMEEAEKLDQEKTTLQRQVDEADNNAREIASGAKNWIDETEKIQAKKREIESTIPNVPKGCLSIIYRFPLSKRAKITAEAMKDLCGRRSHIDPIFLPRRAPAGELPFSSEQPFMLQSRKQTEENVMNELRDQKVNMVGICGMGGIGKTTMAKELRRRVMEEEEEKLFDETVFVVVSQPADMSKIQLDMAEQLGCHDVKDSNSSEVRKKILSARLSGTKRVLIILDDIWEKLKLEDLGIPCGKESKGCTVLLTSRADDVLKQMNVKVVQMGILPQGEAWSLFKDKAGICEDDHNLLTIAEEVANECKGLPVSIVAIGSALKGQELRSWKDVLDRLKSSNPSNMPPYIEKEVYIPLRVSYDFLEDRDANSLFLLCCIFPEDFEIEVEDLALYSMGLKMFGGISNVEQARNRVFTVVKKLKSRFLLLDGYNEKHVKMHDVIREVAISIAKEKRLVDDAEGGYRDSKWLFLDVTGSESFGHLVGSKFPSLQLLIINGPGNLNSRWAHINDVTFLEGMQGLKVLSFKKISFKSVPQSIGLLKDLRTLQLVGCNLNTLSFFGELSRLEVFQCTYCHEIGELPLEFGRLNCLKLVQLSDTQFGKIPAGVISSLVELEELKIVKRSFSRWEPTKVKDEERRNCSLKELEPLTRLTSLELEIKDINLVQENIILPPNIEKYTICIGRSLGYESKYEKAMIKYEKVMILHRIPGESSFGNWIHKLASTAEYLDLDGDGSGNLDLSRSYNSLKELKIANCGMLKELVDTSSSSISINSGESGVFPMLENLKLENLPDLKQICGGPNQQVSLRNLCEVRIGKCPMLQHLFTLERAKGVLLQLKSLTVEDCEMIEQIFILNEEIGIGIESIEFPSLEVLEVSECKQLKRLVFGEWESEHDDLIGSGEYGESPHLFCNTKIKLCGLKDVTLRYDDVSNLWCRLTPMCFFRRLERLQIDNCHNIRSLFTSEMAENLVNLNYLCVKKCDRMEEVFFFFFKKEENDRKTSGITFPKLKRFELYSLPSLTSLGKGFESIEFPQLWRLNIEHCPKLISMVSVMENNGKCDDEEFMPLFCHKKVKVCGLKALIITDCHNIRSVFTSSMVETLVNLRHLHIENCHAMEEVLRNKKNKDEAKTSQIAFLKLEKLRLLRLPSLITMGKGIGNIEFPMLKELEIESCPKLKSMVSPRECNEESAEGCNNDDEPVHILFTGKVKVCGLEMLDIRNCHNITSVFTSSMVEILVNLWYLRIDKCDAMEEVLRNEKNKDEAKTSQIAFLKLKRLELVRLPSLTSMGKGIGNIEFPMLNTLQIESCPKLKSMVSPTECNEESAEWCNNDDEPVHILFTGKVKVCGLDELYIRNCDNITSVFTSSMVEILDNLRYLRIEKCDAMEEVLRNEKNKDEAKTSQIAFLKLETLRLLRLPSLITMGKGIGNIEFPMLKALEIESCPKLKSMVSPRECNEESAEGCNNDDEPFHILVTGKVKFSKLEGLYVKGCHAILGLLSSSTAANLTSLERLRIEECEHMKKVITGVPKQMNANSLFPSLTFLNIANMPSLEKFWEWEDAFKLPVARSTKFFGCPQVKYPQVSAPPSHSTLIKTLKLPDLPIPSNVERLLYMNSGVVLVALDSNTVCHLWTWPHNDHNPSGKSSTSIVPHCYAHASSDFNYNDVKLMEDYVACIALSKNDSYVIYTSGAPEISQLDMKTFTVYGEMIFRNNITYLALHSQDDGNVLAVGNENSTIDIHNLGGEHENSTIDIHNLGREHENSTIDIQDLDGEQPDRVLKGGHQKRISGLAFSQSLNILASSGADAHLCVWSIGDGWEIKKSRPLQAPPGHLTPLDGDTRVQFHNNQSHLLVVHQTQIAIYDAQLECLRSWYPINSLSSPVSCATFSCNGRRIFTGFRDGAVGVFDFEFLTLQFRISPSEYIPSDIPSSSNGFPMVIDIAAHPFDQNQFALTNGALYVIELDDNAEIKSEALTPQVNDGLPSITSSSTINRQKPETPLG